MKYVAGHNQPGYLPNPEDVQEFDSREGAVEYLQGIIPRWAEFDKRPHERVMEVQTKIREKGLAFFSGSYFWIEEVMEGDEHGNGSSATRQHNREEVHSS